MNYIALAEIRSQTRLENYASSYRCQFMQSHIKNGHNEGRRKKEEGRSFNVAEVACTPPKLPPSWKDGACIRFCRILEDFFGCASTTFMGNVFLDIFLLPSSFFLPTKSVNIFPLGLSIFLRDIS